MYFIQSHNYLKMVGEEHHQEMEYKIVFNNQEEVLFSSLKDLEQYRLEAKNEHYLIDIYIKAPNALQWFLVDKMVYLKRLNNLSFISEAKIISSIEQINELLGEKHGTRI